MSLHNYFKALRFRKEALDLRDEVIELLTKNEEQEIKRDEQFRSLLGRYNREVGVLKQQVRDIHQELDNLVLQGPDESLDLPEDGDERDLSEEDKKRLRVLASQRFNGEDSEVV